MKIANSEKLTNLTNNILLWQIEQTDCNIMLLDIKAL